MRTHEETEAVMKIYNKLQSLIGANNEKRLLTQKDIDDISILIADWKNLSNLESKN